jgi:ADP-heptose:LPS heptosyltransferase
LRDRYGIVSVALGSTQDRVIEGTVDLVGKTTLRQAAAVLEHCTLFIGNDSGLKHLAAAAGIPVVEISGFRKGGDPNHPNSPSRFHAWGVPHRVAQPLPGPGMFAIEEVTVDTVQRMCAALLAEVAATPVG